jgi:hypothetical protein
MAAGVVHGRPVAAETVERIGGAERGNVVAQDDLDAGEGTEPADRQRPGSFLDDMGMAVGVIAHRPSLSGDLVLQLYARETDVAGMSRRTGTPDGTALVWSWDRNDDP